MLPTERFTHSPITQRPRLALAGGARLAVWVIVRVWPRRKGDRAFSGFWTAQAAGFMHQRRESLTPTDIFGLRSDQHAVDPAALLCVPAAGRTLRARDLTVEEPLAFITPEPAQLTRNWIPLQGVVPAALLGVLAPGRAFRARILSVEQSLALAAPPPVGLSGRVRIVLDEHIVAASLLAVRASGRARRARIPAEEQSLALAAPPPVGLPGRFERLRREDVTAAAAVRSPGGTDRRLVPREPQALALAAPTPIRLPWEGVVQNPVVAAALFDVGTPCRA